MIITKKEQLIGDILPLWYYGLSYHDWMCAKTVFHPIPINFIIRSFRFLKFHWDKFRSNPTYIDKQIWYELSRRMDAYDKRMKEIIEREL